MAQVILGRNFFENRFNIGNYLNKQEVDRLVLGDLYKDIKMNRTVKLIDYRETSKGLLVVYQLEGGKINSKHAHEFLSRFVACAAQDIQKARQVSPKIEKSNVIYVDFKNKMVLK